MKPQIELFKNVLETYVESTTPVENSVLYSRVARQAGVSALDASATTPIGTARAPRSTFQRAIRCHQQTLRQQGILERIPGKRGLWQLTDKAKRKLRPAKPRVTLLGFSTNLGLAVWGDSQDIFRNLQTPVSLCFTSPPYPLNKPRSYGNVDDREIVAFICDILAPIIEAMTQEGSLVINVSNDIFVQGTPARSTYVERLILTLEDRFGLALMDRMIWHNPTKPPGPLQWASRTRQQLNVAYEPVLWFAKDPVRCKSNNNRVLEPHSDQHQRLMAKGGENRRSVYGDGAYRIRPGSYGQPTAGRIPRNVLKRGHRCAYGDQYRRLASDLDLPLHGAGMPYSIPEFLIQFLTEPGDLVVDPCAGRFMTGLAAENTGRSWMCGELMLEYLRGGAELFRSAAGFRLNPDIESI